MLRLFVKCVLPVVTFLLLISGSRVTPAFADDVCYEDCFRGIAKKDINPEVESARVRNAVTDHARKNKLPAMVLETRNGDLPVILMDKRTAPQYRDMIENSFGVEIVLQPDWHNDHGLARVSNAIIDADLPGARGYGELWKTGIAWKNFDTYMPRRTADHGVVVEVAFAVTPEEKETMLYYQKVRRAAIIRAPFTFGGGNVDRTLPNMLSGGENCFVFCRSSGLSGHLTEMEAKLRGFGINDVNDFLNQENTQAYLNAARKKIVETDAFLLKNPPLNPKMTISAELMPLLQKILPPGLDNDSQSLFANWLVGYDASRRYKTFLANLGISGGSGVEAELNRERATAMIIYDESTRVDNFGGAQKTVVDAFSDLSYAAKGIFYATPTTGLKRLNP